jgi:hypothetical protein
LSGNREGGGGEDDGDGVGADLEVVAAPASDFESDTQWDEVGDDGVGPAEPVSGPLWAVGHGPVVDVGEGGGGTDAADSEQDEHKQDSFESLGLAHDGLGHVVGSFE